MKDNMEMVGKVAFIVGLLLVVVAGLVASVAAYAYTALIIVVLGLVVGFLNVAEKNVVKLLVAIVALMAVGAAAVSVIPALDVYLGAILNNFLVFVGAAGLVVAVKAIVEVIKK